MPRMPAKHGPIQSHLHETMNHLAQDLDEAFNGPNWRQDGRTIGFIMLAFDFGPSERINYISNCNRNDAAVTMKKWLQAKGVLNG